MQKERRIVPIAFLIIIAFLFPNYGHAALIQLTNSPSYHEKFPAWSPDGTQIAFSRHIIGSSNSNIWVMNIDGTAQNQLTESIGYDQNAQPKWSSDGTEIIFWAFRPWGQGGSIWKMNAEGSNENKLYVKTGYDSHQPVFSPDGTKITFTSSKRYGGIPPAELYTMNSDGSEANKILNALNDSTPDSVGRDNSSISYSPDGQWIAFDSQRSGYWDIWVVKPDGSNLTQLTNDVNRNHYPAWSPNGNQIAFISNRSGNDDIWILTNVYEVISNNGIANYVQVTTSPYSDKYPTWSPDGAKIAFSTYSNDNWDIWIIDVLCKGDFDGDGDVDGSDLAIFAADFGRTNCPPCQ